MLCDLAHLLYHAGHANALEDIQVRRQLVEEIKVGLSHDGGGDGHALQLSAGELRDVPVQDLLQVQLRGDFLKHAALVGLLQKIDDLALEGLRYEVDVLGLLRRLDGFIGHALHVVLKLGAGEELENVIPRRLSVAEVRHHLAR